MRRTSSSPRSLELSPKIRVEVDASCFFKTRESAVCCVECVSLLKAELEKINERIRKKISLGFQNVLTFKTFVKTNIGVVCVRVHTSSCTLSSFSLSLSLSLSLKLLF